MGLIRWGVVGASISFAAAALAGDFTYSVPKGFRELVNEPAPVDVTDLPPGLYPEAAGGKFVLFAVDPVTTSRDRLGAFFNVVERPGKVHITDEVCRKMADELLSQLRGQHLTGSLVNSAVIQMNGVATAMYTVDMRTPDGWVRSRQYAFPGRNSAALLTYVAPRDQFAKFESEFVASARATQGAYDPGAFHWSQFLLSSGFSAAVAGAVGALIAFMRRRHHEAEIKAEQAEPPGAPVLAPAPAKVPLRKPSKHVWYCDSCGNPVPMRLEQCRCGGKKPA